MGDEFVAVDGTDDVEGERAQVALPGRRRRQDSVRRTLRLTPRFSVRERSEIEAAAAAVGMSVNGFAAEAVVNVARGVSVSYSAAVDREVLARLQRELFHARTAVNRFGSNVNQAVATLHATDHPPIEALTHAAALCSRAVRNVDGLVDELHKRLR